MGLFDKAFKIILLIILIFINGSLANLAMVFGQISFTMIHPDLNLHRYDFHISPATIPVIFDTYTGKSYFRSNGQWTKLDPPWGI